MAAIFSGDLNENPSIWRKMSPKSLPIRKMGCAIMGNIINNASNLKLAIFIALRTGKNPSNC